MGYGIYEIGGIRFTKLEESGVDLESVMSKEAYDVYIHCDDNFWLGSNGVIYDFQYYPTLDQYIKEYDNWDEFNEVYPK